MASEPPAGFMILITVNSSSTWTNNALKQITTHITNLNKYVSHFNPRFTLMFPLSIQRVVTSEVQDQQL